MWWLVVLNIDIYKLGLALRKSVELGKPVVEAKQYELQNKKDVQQSRVFTLSKVKRAHLDKDKNTDQASVGVEREQRQALLATQLMMQLVWALWLEDRGPDETGLTKIKWSKSTSSAPSRKLISL
ncbi:unnamed protein product [Cylicostephanus goldi]|uniref:Uncharacterized protein n=1 Tax=Cylicostephanus goldi TaxID=71465 RepID=A0A3P7MDC7_CYLGO|nr:unnamed protein product [Cylicostephanus goldi]